MKVYSVHNDAYSYIDKDPCTMAHFFLFFFLLDMSVVGPLKKRILG